MAYNYQRAAETARRAIEKYGGAGQVISKGNKGGFDENGDAIPAQPDDIIHGTITPPVLYSTREIDGKTILSGDSWVYFSSEQRVDVNMHVTLNSVTYRVAGVIKLASNSDEVIYRKLKLRV